MSPTESNALRARVDHLPTAIRLDRFPNLTYAPAQHGEGVRTHLKGVLVDDIALSAKGSGLLAKIEIEAAKHGVDIEELLDAIRYAHVNKLV